MRPWLVLAIVLPVPACTEPALDLTVDTGTRCGGVAVQVLDDAVLPGWTIHALAILDASGEEGWALAVAPDKRLLLQPLPSGAPLDLSELALTGTFELLPGPVPGEAWLLYDDPTRARVWRLGDAAHGEVVEAPDLTGFPLDEGEWTRRLVFVGATPYLLAAPSTGDASTLQLPLARLDRETLAIVHTSDIDFWGNCDDPIEAELDASCTATPFEQIEQIELLSVTQADGAGAAVVLVGLHAVQPSETPELPGLHHTEVSSLELRDAGVTVPPDTYRHVRASWDGETELMISVAQVGADDESMYVLAGVAQPPDVEQSLLQKDWAVRAEHSDPRRGATNDIFAYFGKDLRTHLLQIDGEVAVGQFNAGKWLVAPIVIDDDTELARVDTKLVAGLTVPDGTVAHGVGFGQVLLTPPQGPAQRVTLVCDDDARTE